ncbi:MAG TPA: AsmA family protein, partial [Reyranella sp.]|nr:AsmA family protein [Reyranella sp.]
MKRALKILGWTFGILVVLAGTGVGAAYYFLTSDDFREIVEGQASTYSGRKTKIEKVSIAWSSEPQVHLSNVQFANAKWAKNEHMLKAEQIDFSIRLWPLLK